MGKFIVPVIGMYVATKHAVKGYTDALRVEVEDVDVLPVSVTLIQPTAVDTPFPQNARNYLPFAPMLPEPRIDPQEVAAAILHAAAHPTRAKVVGATGVVNTLLSKLVPGLADEQVAKLADKMHYDEPPRHPDGALYRPCEAGGVAGRTHGTGGKKPE